MTTIRGTIARDLGDEPQSVVKVNETGKLKTDFREYVLTDALAKEFGKVLDPIIDSAGFWLDLHSNPLDGRSSRSHQCVPDPRDLETQARTEGGGIDPDGELLLAQRRGRDVVRERPGECSAHGFLERDRGFGTIRQVLQAGRAAADEFT